MKKVQAYATQRRFFKLGSLTLGSFAFLSLISTLLLFAQEKKASVAPGGADLEAVSSESLVEITTIGRKSGKSRTTTIWFIYDNGHFYIQSGKGGKTSWYRNLKKNKQIDVKVADLTFTAFVQFITDSTETERIHEMFRSKYLRARLAGWVGSDVGHGKVVQIGLPFSKSCLFSNSYKFDDSC